MIDTNEVIEFFDRMAPGWDAEMIKYDDVICRILDNAKIKEGNDVLDVASGTGVLIPDYLARNVASITAIDISPEMTRIALTKFKAPGNPVNNLSIICGDVETHKFEGKFDNIIIYNAFPHFPDPDRLIRILSEKLKTGGTLSVAHGMSREKINSHHKGSASHVSNGLLPVEELANIFKKYLKVTVAISDEKMYQVVGRLQ